jgi:hypothetical protein
VLMVNSRDEASCVSAVRVRRASGPGPSDNGRHVHSDRQTPPGISSVGTGLSRTVWQEVAAEAGTSASRRSGSSAHPTRAKTGPRHHSLGAETMPWVAPGAMGHTDPLHGRQGCGAGAAGAT